MEEGFEVVGGDGRGRYFLAFNPDVFVAGFREGGAQVEVLNVNCKPFLLSEIVECSSIFTTSRLAVRADTS